MRVLILGPVINDKVSGGVAVFDEGLYSGFLKLGDEVNILSIDSSSSINNIALFQEVKNPNKVFLYRRRIAKKIKEFKPDLVISSLQYSSGIKVYKRHYPSAKYVHILHGVPRPINGKFKSWIINKVAKKARKYSDFVVTISYFSFAINKYINGITCDKVIHNGTSLVPSKVDEKRIYDYIYIGRLHPDKQVGMILEAFSKIKQVNPSLRCVIAGYGEQESLFADSKNKGVEFVGKLSSKEVNEYLNKSKFFVSMDPLEGFGNVFAEAVCNGCNIVCPSSCGSAPIFEKEEYYHSANCLNSNELVSKLLEIYPKFSKITFDKKEQLAKYLSYERVAQEYKDLCLKK